MKTTTFIISVAFVGMALLAFAPGAVAREAPACTAVQDQSCPGTVCVIKVEDGWDKCAGPCLHTDCCPNSFTCEEPASQNPLCKFMSDCCQYSFHCYGPAIEEDPLCRGRTDCCVGAFHCPSPTDGLEVCVDGRGSGQCDWNWVRVCTPYTTCVVANWNCVMAPCDPPPFEG